MAREQRVSERYAIGLAGRSGVEVGAGVALVRAALAEWRVGLADASLNALGREEDRAAFVAIAATLGAPLRLVEAEALLARKDDVLTQSPRVLAMFGIGSVAEALALVGAGEGGKLLGPRLATERLTCAIARVAQAEDTP